MSYFPDEWKSVFEVTAPGFNAQFEPQVGNSSEPWYVVAGRVASTLIMTDFQRRLLNIQLDRAEQGLPPLDPGQYGVGVNVGLSPDTQKLLIVGGLALVGLFLFVGSRR